MNVTHWPDCFINKNFPKSADSTSDPDTPQVNQLTPPSPPPNNTRPQNNTPFSSDMDNLIYVQEHKIAIVAWVYNAQWLVYYDQFISFPFLKKILRFLCFIIV